MQLGLIGLGTMGANLARNAARNGARVAVYNRTQEKTDAFMKEFGSEGDPDVALSSSGRFVACKTLKELIDALDPPRAILLMVKAGQPVDDLIESLTSDDRLIDQRLSQGDILIDGGNSHYLDTERRVKELSEKGIRFLGMGVSGGEAGALNGPSMMPGGDESAYRDLEPMLMKMAADVTRRSSSRLSPVDEQSSDERQKCITYIGPGGSGHFVKMVHNGIEYGLMQLIAESYDILRREAGKTNGELAEIYGSWNEGEDLQSFLVEITAKIFQKKEGDGYLIDVIRDSAGQKGTGKWTTEAALDLGVPIPTINAAVDTRILSGDVEHRTGGRVLPEAIEQPYAKPEKLVSGIRTALELGSILTYLQGFELLKKASEVYQWDLNPAEVARIWRGGCIIRSAFLEKLQKAFAKDPGSVSDAKKEMLERFTGERQLDWRRAIAIAQGRGVPVPAMSSALSYFDALRAEKLPQNLIQAQRDFFGAHTFERIDKEGVFHAEWDE